MEIGELITFITQNGIGVVCVGFMIFFINNTMAENTKMLNEIKVTLVSIQSTLTNLTTRVDNIENHINIRKEDK